jgi:hypothetical protein
MLNREYYMINNDTRRVYDTYKEAQAKAAGYRIDKLVMADKWVVPEDWGKPDEEWVTPTDEDARHRPMVQVSFFGEWYDAKLLAVTEYDKDGSFVVEGCFNHREGVKTYMSCRMRASERKVK